MNEKKKDYVGSKYFDDAEEKAKKTQEVLKSVNVLCVDNMNMPAYFKTSMDNIQALRTKLNTGITLKSEHRCYTHNGIVSTAGKSAHLWLAFDCGVKFGGHLVFANAAYAEGFLGFGFADNFVHLDMRMNKDVPAGKYGTVFGYGATSATVKEYKKTFDACMTMPDKKD